MFRLASHGVGMAQSYIAMSNRAHDLCVYYSFEYENTNRVYPKGQMGTMSPTPVITARTRHCAMRYDRTHTHTHLYTPTRFCSLAAWSPNPFKLCPGFGLSQSTP